ncbi:MAG: hypothetical protein ACRDTT_33235, partial [Pseudonocardiaceae bacterium]
MTHHLPWPPQSGGRLREAELLRRLASRFDIELVAVSKVPDLDLAHVRQASRYGIHTRVFSAQEAGPGRWSSHVRRHHSPAAHGYLRHRLANDEDVVVHVEGHYVMGLLPLTVRRQALVVEHNIESTLFEQRAALTTITHERQRLLRDAELTRRTERAAWRTARMVAALTREDASVIQEAAPSTEVRVLPDGADHLARPTVQRTMAPSDSTSLLFVANLAYHPNQDAARNLVTEIFPAILARCPDETLTIVGAAPPEWLLNIAASESR